MSRPCHGHALRLIDIYAVRPIVDPERHRSVVTLEVYQLLTVTNDTVSDIDKTVVHHTCTTTALNVRELLSRSQLRFLD